MIENNYSFKEILSSVNMALGKKEPRLEAGKALLTIGKWLDGIKSFFTNKEQIITKETINATLDNNSYNNNRIKEVINHQFIPLKDTVQFVCGAYLKDIRTK